MDQQPTIVDVPAIAKELGARFADADHELYLVGGSVRDLILGRPTIDLDFCTSAHPTETTKVLQGWADRRYLMGVTFGTVGALKDGERLEITTDEARRTASSPHDFDLQLSGVLDRGSAFSDDQKSGLPF